MALVDNTAKSRFEYMIEGHIAFIAYRRTPGVIALTHAEVPTEIEGRGVGSMLTRAVLDAVRGTGEKVIPQCSFVEAFLRRNPEYEDLLAK
jgi:predicted GNAT family acetyltransferase